MSGVDKAGNIPAGYITGHNTAHKSDNWKLRTARNEGSGHDGKTSVIVLFNGLGGHDSRNTAAGRNQQRDEALTGQSEVTEHTVHNEGDTYHVAAVLKDRQEQEQDCHLRHEAKHSTRPPMTPSTARLMMKLTCACIGEEGSCCLLDRAYKGYRWSSR